MGKRERRIFTEDFKKEAVRLTETSGRTIGQSADDLGVGLSSLTRWKRQYREADLLAGPHEDTIEGGGMITCRWSPASASRRSEN
jgi:transposase